MSNKDEVILALKNLAKAIIPSKEDVVVIEEKFMDAKLVDGTIVRYDAEVIATGVIVSVVDEAGMVLPLPLGSYALEDGTTFDVVDASGVADNVVLAEAEVVAPEMPEEMENEIPVAPVAEAKAKTIIESTVKESRFKKDEKMESIKLEFASELKTVNEKLEAQDKMIKEMFALIEMLGNEDAAKATETKVNVFKKKTAKELQVSFRTQLYK